MTFPVPDQLAVQLAKCKSVRGIDYHKSRGKTPQVSITFSSLLGEIYVSLLVSVVEIHRLV